MSAPETKFQGCAPLRILQYSYGGSILSGIDSYLTETYDAINRAKIQFDFLYRYGCPLGVREAALRSQGAQIESLAVDETAHPIRRQLQEAVRLWRFFNRNRYDIVEINMTALFMILSCAIIARMSGASVVVVHAHDSVKSERPAKRLLKKLFSPLLEAACTDFWACSREAAQYLFSSQRVQREQWVLIKNGIDVSKHGYSEENRVAIRDELTLAGSRCVGMVGRFTEQKNHHFALRVAKEARRIAPEMKFMMVGDGPTLAKVTAQSHGWGLTDTVRFLGVRHDVNALMSGFDVLIAPSRHEGFPLVALEAQCADLPMIVSDAFPPESNVTGNMEILSLRDAPSEWASRLASIKPVPRFSRGAEISAAGYTREATARQLEALYESLANGALPRG